MFFNKKQTPEKVDIREGYDQWAASYSSESNPIKSASDDSIKKMLPSLKNLNVIDAGCGSGYFCQYAEQSGASQIKGIDFSRKMIEKANQICQATKFIEGDLQEVELQVSSADVIICALVLGHLEKIDGIILKFAKTLKKDGLLLISDFHPFLSRSGQKRTFRAGGKFYEIPHHIHMLHEYINLLGESDLSMLKMEEPVWQGNPVIFALKAKKN